MQNDHSHAHGGNKPTYNFIFVILVILTIIEVGVGQNLSRTLSYVILLALALTKAGLVAAYYMHLKYDPPLYTWLLVVPVLAAVALMLSLQGLTGY